MLPLHWVTFEIHELVVQFLPKYFDFIKEPRRQLPFHTFLRLAERLPDMDHMALAKVLKEAVDQHFERRGRFWYGLRFGVGHIWPYMACFFGASSARGASVLGPVENSPVATRTCRNMPCRP